MIDAREFQKTIAAVRRRESPTNAREVGIAIEVRVGRDFPRVIEVIAGTRRGGGAQVVSNSHTLCIAGRTASDRGAAVEGDGEGWMGEEVRGGGGVEGGCRRM